MTTDTEALRAEFEAWANGILALAYECEKGRYVDGYSETCFQCWQAARRTPAVPEGWRLVPDKPTVAMLRAAQSAWNSDPQKRTSTLWDAMLSTAPKEPT